MSYKQMTGNLISATKLVPTANSSAAYGVATGVWNLNDMYDYKRGGQWPIPAGVPGAPTITGVTGGNAQVAVAFSANASTGGLDVSSFTALASSGQSASATSSPITVTSLTNGTAITFTVKANNAAGASAASSASSSVTPSAPQYALIIFPKGSGEIARFDMTTTGSFTDHGDDLITDKLANACAGSATIALWGGNADNASITYSTFATAGNTTDFGDVAVAATYSAGLSNGTNAFFFGGGGVGGGALNTTTNVIQSKAFSSSGNMTDYGDLSVARRNLRGCGSPTRGLVGAGYTGSAYSNVVDYFSLSSSGNATDFGNLSLAGRGTLGPSFSSSVRAFWAGGVSTSSYDNGIDYFTIASTGNATDFGDLVNDPVHCFGVSNATHGFMGGGYATNGLTNLIQRITMATTGSAEDYDDLDAAKAVYSSVSSAHGGIA